MGIEKIPLTIPEQWSPTWMRMFITEVLSKLDTRNAIGLGVDVSSVGNSVATLNVEDTINTAIDTAMDVHEAAPDPHPGYLTQAEADALYAVIAHTHATLPLTGTGDPESVVVAPVGTLFLRSDGGTLTTLYVKETGAGNTGWVAK